MSANHCIGIDLGTTYCCIGVVNNKNVDIIANDQGVRTTPSYISFTEDDRLIGAAAKSIAARNPKNTVYDAKRLIGRNFKDKTIQQDMKLWSFDVVSGKQNNPLIKVQYKHEDKEFTPEEISSMLLVHLKETAEAFLGSEVKTESANAISIKDGPSAIDLRGVTANLTNLYKDLCAKYEELLSTYQYNNTLVGQAILGPYSPGSMVVNSNQFDYRGNLFN